MKYKEQLLDSRWKRKRAKILKRDNYVCTKCDSSDELNVHHIYYIKGKSAWQYPNNALITLCNKCHKKWHDNHDVEVRDKAWNKNKEYQPLKKGTFKKRDKVSIPTREKKKIDHKIEYKKHSEKLKLEKLELINNSSLKDELKERLIKKENGFTAAKLIKMIKELGG